MNTKKFVSAAVAATMLCSFTACDFNPVGNSDVPDKSVVQADVESYITDFVDESASISSFQVNDDFSDSGTYEVNCIAAYQGDTTKYIDRFSVKYDFKDGEWELAAVSIDDAYDKKVQTDLDTVSSETVSSEVVSSEPAESSDEDVSSMSEVSSTVSSESSGTAVSSDKLSDYSFALDGAVYALPCPFSDFSKNGWEVKDYSVKPTDEVPSNSYQFVTLAKGDNKIMVDVVNFTGNVLKVTDCKVGGISINKSDVSSKSIFSIGSMDLNFDGALLKSKYGEPTSTYDGSMYTDYRYEFGLYDSYEFYFGDDYQSVKIRHFKRSDEDTTATSNEKPDYLKSYKAPSALGTDITSGVVQIDGDLYKFPAPVTEFINNGWVMDSSVSSIGGQTYEIVTFTRNNQTIRLNVRNFADYQTTPENCAVSGISLYSDENIKMTFSGGLMIGMSESGAKEIMGDHFRSVAEDKMDMYFYDDEATGISMTFYVDKATKRVNYGSITADKWR